MDSTLLNSLEKAGVRQNIIEILEEEEFDTVGLLRNTSDELLKACNIKGGQIVRIRNALATCILSQDEQGTQEKDGMATEFQGIVPSTPRETPSTPRQTPSTQRPTPSTPRPTPSTPRPTPSIPREMPSTPTPSTPTPSTCIPRPSMSSAFGMDIQLPSASDGSSPTCSSFAIKETHKGNRNQNWIKDFKLPDSFSPSVNQGLKAGQLSGNTRDEFTRDVCTAIKTHSLYPTKAEKDRVASLIVQKYPFLEDSIGAGLGSWSKAITNRFKNLRRKKTPPRTIASVMKPNAEQPSAPKKRKLCDDPLQYAEGETEETCKEHTKLLKKEMARTSNKNQSLIKELMCVTYPYRRQNLLLKTKGINDIVAEFPARQLVSEIKAEFDRILSERKVVRRMVENYKAIQQKILDVTAKSPNKNTKRIISDMGSMVSEEPEKKSDIESTASVLALQCILKEKAAGENLFFMICPEDQSIDEAVSKTTYPRLIGCGDLSQLDPFVVVVAAEGQVFTKLSSVTIPFAVALLLATFYVFNIEYTRGVSNVYAFLEAIMLTAPNKQRKEFMFRNFLRN